jgi:hypothetical protein
LLSHHLSGRAGRNGEHNHPEITMSSVPMAEHMIPIRANDWPAVAEILLASARKVGLWIQHDY